MFRFREIELHGWDVWPDVRIPLDAAVVVLSGPNGSGKTTLLDAIRQILHAPKLSQRRRLSHYLRRPNRPALLRAVVTNLPDAAGRRPFDRQRIFGDEATLACALLPSGGTPDLRYAIMDGRIPAHVLQEHLLEGRDWLGPDDYRRAIDYAGVSRSLMNILALEQGKADELARQKPPQLFRWVMEARGSQSVLARYSAARRQYDESLKKVGEQRQQLLRHQARLVHLEGLVRRLDEHTGKQRHYHDALELREAARYQAMLTELREIERKLPELRTKVTNLAPLVDRLSYDVIERERSIVNLRENAERAARNAQKATTECDESIRRKAELANRVQSLAGLQDEHRGIVEEDAVALNEELDRARKAQFEADQLHVKCKAELERIKQMIEALESGIPTLPAEVASTMAALEQASITAHLTATSVEIGDGSWTAALESALGPLRYALCVAQADEARVVEIAREHAFPGPIVIDVLDEVFSAGPMTIGAGAPSWLAAWAHEVRLVDASVPPQGKLIVTPSGVRRDGYGVWVSAVPDRVLGGAAVRSQLEAAQLQRDQLIESTKTASGAHETAQTAVEDLEKRADRQQRRAYLTRELEALPKAQTELAAATREEEQGKRARDTAGQEQLEAQGALTWAEADLPRAREELEKGRKELDGTRSALTEGERRLAEQGPQTEKFAEALRSSFRKDAEAGRLPTEQLAEKDVQRAQEDLRNFEKEGVPDPIVRDERESLARNIKDLEDHIEDRQREADAARREVDCCRGDYIEVIRSTLNDYSRRARALAEIARAKLEIDLPKLENTDKSLDEAGIAVRVGFDGKPPVDVGDSSHSGGQQVINAFILLMSMAETEGEGFFIVDEPFAHLSIDRIDEVGTFLRRSGAQFLITVPTTLDRAQLDPASLVIVLRKKKPGETYAPPPLVGRA